MSDYDHARFTSMLAQISSLDCNYIPDPGDEALKEVILRAYHRKHMWSLVNPGQVYKHTEEFAYSSGFSSEIVERYKLLGIVIQKDTVEVYL